MIDGTVARKLNAVSTLGSKLDTIADFVFMAVCVVKLLPVIDLPFLLWVWIAVIAIIKINTLVLGFVYKKKLVDLHTVLNKTTGLFLFLLPFILRFIEPTLAFSVVCITATVAAVEESYRTIKAKDK
jgi:CDP-diacylglycerol--glycerol-3-phosphate 3-phosphatidyltransferase